MKYCIKGVDIHSDRAAIPSGRKSKRYLRFLSSIGRHESCLDYGCGKLRHLEEMLTVFRHITAVDSEAQVTKTQKIHGIETTVEKFCRRYRRISAYKLDDVSKIKRRHDWAFLNNVLSAIPERGARIKALVNIRKLLKPGARLLIVTQFKNSKFDAFANGKKHFDGHIHHSTRGLHFFGLISDRVLKNYLQETGYREIVIRPVSGYFFTTARK
jgi:SAM-dependent methyltransferase